MFNRLLWPAQPDHVSMHTLLSTVPQAICLRINTTEAPPFKPALIMRTHLYVSSVVQLACQAKRTLVCTISSSWALLPPPRSTTCLQQVCCAPVGCLLRLAVVAEVACALLKSIVMVAVADAVRRPTGQAAVRA